MTSDSSASSALSACDICGTLAPWATLLPLGQVDFILDTPAGRQLVGSRPLRGCRPPWRQDRALHGAALAWAPLAVTRAGRFTRRRCRIRWRDLPGDSQRAWPASALPHPPGVESRARENPP